MKSYDPATRTGVLLTDQDEEIAIEADSFPGPELRLLRFGQRLDLEVVDVNGRKTARELKIPTF